MEQIKMVMYLVIFLAAIAIVFAILPSILSIGKTGGPSFLDVLFGWIGG